VLTPKSRGRSTLFNPWWGCTKVSSGCDHCYAESLDKHWYPRKEETDVLIATITTTEALHWGKGQPRRIMSDDYWQQPLKWNKAAQREGVKHKVFCASMADVMDDEAPDGQRERLWELINNTPHLIWQLLTKRPTRYTSYLPPLGFVYRNVWLGTSAENQHFYDIRWSVLRVICKDFQCPSFISYEPALGPLSIVAFVHNLPREGDGFDQCPDWLICGAESGANRRPMEQKWAEDAASDCEITGTKFWMKQMSARTPEQGAQLIPPHLLIRQFPGGTE